MTQRNSSAKQSCFFCLIQKTFSASINPANIIIIYSEKAGISAKLVFIFNFLMLY